MRKPAALLFALALAAGCAAAPAPSAPRAPAAPAARPSAPRPVAVVADPAFPRDRLRARFGANTTFFDASDLASIRAFSAKGGRIVVAYSGDAALGRFMGVQPGAWRRVDCAALGAGGRVLCAYRPGCAYVPSIPKGNPLHARVTATMLDSSLRDTGLAGVVETDRGVWYAHAVPPPPMAGGALDRLPDALRTRGVWSAGQPLDPRGWPATAAKLAATGFNTVFLKSDAPGFAAAAAACRRAGLAVHAWMTVFEGGRRSPARKADVDAAVLEAARLAARKDIDGIQFDYIRYPAGAGGDAAVAAAHMRDVSAAMKRLSAAVRARNRALAVSAAVYPVPRTQQSVGQNVAQWLRLKYVDFVSPMCYTSSEAEFSGWLAENLAAIPASRLVAGIGCGANESRLDSSGVKRQVGAAQRNRLRGVSLYALDAELAARLKKGGGK